MMNNNLQTLLFEKSFAQLLEIPASGKWFWKKPAKQYILWNNYKFETIEDFENNIDVIFSVIQRIYNDGYEFYIFNDEIRVRDRVDFKTKIPPIQFSIKANDFQDYNFNTVKAIHLAIQKFYELYGKNFRNR